MAVVCEKALTGPLNERYGKDGGEKHSDGVTHEGVFDALPVGCSHGVVVVQKRRKICVGSERVPAVRCLFTLMRRGIM